MRTMKFTVRLGPRLLWAPPPPVLAVVSRPFALFTRTPVTAEPFAAADVPPHVKLPPPVDVEPETPLLLCEWPGSEIPAV